MSGLDGADKDLFRVILDSHSTVSLETAELK